MGDDSLIPISDEQAKLGQELVKAVRDTSGYFTHMQPFGILLMNVVSD